MPADWITDQEVLAWVGPMADAARLSDSTAAAKRYVEDRRSDLDLAARRIRHRMTCTWARSFTPA